MILEFLTDNWLGIIGFVSGILCVWLLIRENVLTFPIGLIYAVVTVVVMMRNQLYADTLLNLYYVAMNGYGWYFWLRGADSTRRRSAGDLDITWTPPGQLKAAVCVIVLGSAAMGWYFANWTRADYAYTDSFTTVTSFVAMWMAARKYLENWILWFVVNVISVGVYVLKAGGDEQLYFYAVLYAIYLLLAVVGWQTWRKKMAWTEQRTQS